MNARTICRLFGHREYSKEVLEARPWDDPDFYGCSREDFREANCVRCGDPLEAAQAA
jgi:hypothetical protein